MANETVTQETNDTVIEKQERTFTQAEVDAIVTDRLNRNKAKYADYDALKEKASLYDESVEASKSELQKATERADALQRMIDEMNRDKEISEIRLSVAKSMNIPVDLLNGTTPEECEAQAQAILEFAKPKSYPSVKDGGEVNVTHKKTDVEQFTDWFNQMTNN